ncbi:hypothetical protein E8E12_000898 [Didymella heteroderae]|uniref:Urease accessory protein UreD n=1 Tax=Didymella heteroderae TaxID=1769908 RepID=A0A9P5BUJ5_9PLEO|nr:hypothetical protein E8E12_000898 [Didymella heteroderae]
MSFASPFESPTSKPGCGSIVLSVLPPDKPVLAKVFYQYPLKLVAPCPLPPPAQTDGSANPSLIHTVYLLTYGGGIVAGDAINLEVSLNSGTRLVLLTQGSTKIFKTLNPSMSSTQSMHVRLGHDSALVYLPDPVQPFAQTTFSQSQVYHLTKGGGSLCVCDWVTSGRSASGEHWDIYEYRSRNEVWATEGREQARLLLRDSVVLDKHGRTDMQLASRMGEHSAFGTLIIRGPTFDSLARHFRDEFEALPRIGGREWGDVVRPELTHSERRRVERQD